MNSGRYLLRRTNPRAINLGASALGAVVVILAGWSAAAAQAVFPCGVASGDVTETAAFCWTRTATAGTLRFEVAADSPFATPIVSALRAASTDTDLTVKVEITGLSPGTRYYFRFTRTDTNDVSPVGTFVTAPAADDARSFRFLYSGDSNAADQPFHLLGHAVTEEPDFWIWAGDIIYSDIPAGDLGVATDLAGYRGRYAQNLEDAYLQKLLAVSPVWVQWDDHEVANDYDGGDLEPGITRQRQLDAYQAFFEYLPIRPQNVSDDPWRIYRSFHYGELAEFFVLDCRQYRSRDVARDGGGLDPRAFFLPTFELQTIQRMCDPSRTMLGTTQLEWIEQALLNSTARWKFILSSVTFTSLLVYPQDRWDGYDAERYKLLRFIDDKHISGVVILSADIHGNVHNPDVTQFLRNALHEGGFSPGFVIPEFVTGPIGTETIRQEIEDIAAAALDEPAEQLGACGVFNLGIDALVTRITFENKLTFVEPNKYAYLVVDVSPDGLTFTHRGVPPDPQATDAPLETLHTATLSNPLSATASLPCFIFPFAAILLIAGSAAVSRAARSRLPVLGQRA